MKKFKKFISQNYFLINLLLLFSFSLIIFIIFFKKQNAFNYDYNIKTITVENIQDKGNIQEDLKTEIYSEYIVSAYCNEDYPHICNNGNSKGTASGNIATPYKTMATDTTVLPFGTKVYIPGYGEFISQDRGGSIKKNKIDILVKTHEEAIKFGVRKMYLKSY